MPDRSAPPVLSYGRQPRRWLTRSQRWLARGALALIAFNVALAAMGPWKTRRIDVCVTCGSTRTRTATWFGHRRATTTQPTDLHAWLVARDGVHEHDWQFLTEWMSPGSRACASAPPSYTVRAFDGFLTDAPDAEIATLAAALRHFDEKQQDAAVQRFGDIVFGPANHP